MFITFEGTEGAGKTTAISAVADFFREAGREVVTTREPGSGSLGVRIRELLLHAEDMCFESELFLFLADRSQHVRSIVQPALASGKIVLCDRYADSTLVYQGLVRGLDEGFVRQANRFAIDDLVPDRTYLLDLPVEIGLSRLKSRDRLDAQPIEFHRQVREGFLRLAREEPERFAVIDASGSPNSVVDLILSDLRQFEPVRPITK